MTQREDKEKNKAARENLGKYFYDLSKGSFMVMVVGNAVTIITNQNFTLLNVALVITGIFLTWGFAYFANFIFKRK